MMSVISITDVEAALNKCTKSQPPEGNRLSKEGSMLSEIYGLMIYYHLAEAEPEVLLEKRVVSKDHLDILEKWL